MAVEVEAEAVAHQAEVLTFEVVQHRGLQGVRTVYWALQQPVRDSGLGPLQAS